MKKILSFLIIATACLSHTAAKDIPENAIPFILDSHVYV